MRHAGMSGALLLCGAVGYEWTQPALLTAANAATAQQPAIAKTGVPAAELPVPAPTPMANQFKPDKTVVAAPALRWGNGVLRETNGEAAPVIKSKRQAAIPKPQPPAPLPFTHTLEIAWQAYQQGKYSLARERYEQVLDGDNNIDVQLGLAAIAVRQNRNDQATLFYQRALMLDPRNTTALAALATLGDGRPADDIETHIKQMLDQQPSASLQFSLGNLYAGQQRWREAEAAYFESYQADTHNADYAYNLAISLDYLRLYQPALTYYLKAQELALAGGAHGDALRLNTRIQQLQDQLTP